VGKVDFLIVGQGIAGTLLAMELMNSGYKVVVFNEEKPNTSSLKAGGLYNPITGRKMVKTWMADELFLNLESYYQKLEHQLDARFIFPMPIYRLFFNYEEQNDWAAKAADPAYSHFIKELHASSLGIEGVQDEYGGLLLNHSGYVNLPNMLAAARKYLDDRGIYRSEVFQYDQMILQEDNIEYQGLEVGRVIFCDGPEAIKNPYWEHLPFNPVKGETLVISTELPSDMIINRGVFVLPRDGHYVVGATYDHKQLDYEPTAEGIKNLQDRLHKIFKGKYELVSSSAGIRPATFDRRPFIGFHSEHPQIGIFNGFGTKGVSLVPYFAGQLVNYLKGGGQIMDEVNVSRVTR